MNSRSLFKECNSWSDFQSLLMGFNNKEKGDAFELLTKQLEPKERLEVLIKLMPFVFPRMNTMSHSMDEPVDFLGW